MIYANNGILQSFKEILTLMELGDIVLSKMSQKQKDKYCVITFRVD